MLNYAALGDSISIDAYTSVAGGGAASQLARMLGARGAAFQNLTRDGNVSSAALIDLERIQEAPDVVTLTIGGNDFLLGRPAVEIVGTIRAIAGRLAELGGTVIMNTVYDPTDGDDRLGAQLGLGPEQRREYERMNQGIREIARERGFLLSDLQRLFQGSGIAAPNPWICCQIEPNLLGATATAAHWMGLLAAHPDDACPL